MITAVLLSFAFLAVTPFCATAADFAHPERVTIRGYDRDAMEPFITRDGKYLLFNNSNDPSVDTNLHYGESFDAVTFDYRGEIEALKSAKLDAVASMSAAGELFFISTRSYDDSLSTVYRSHFTAGIASAPLLVPGVSLNARGSLVFDLDVSPDGNALIVADGTFSGGATPDSANLAFLTREGDSFRRDKVLMFGAVNTDALEYAPALSADGLELYFTRFAPAWLLPLSKPPAIYLARRPSRTDAFGPAERVAAIDGFAEAPSLSPDERALYFHKKVGDRYEIWRVTR